MDIKMQEMDFDRLRPIGLSAAMAQTIAISRQTTSGAPLRVTEVHRETVRASDGVAEFTLRVMPRLQRSLADEAQSLAVGDWLLAEPDRFGDWWVHTRIAPQTQLARRDMHGLPQVFASNVDTALLVMGLDADFSPRRLERYLALVQVSGVLPVVVLSKVDLRGNILEERLQALATRFPASLDVVAVNALDGNSVAQLAPWLGQGQTLVLLGSSGAGKSTLTNTLLGNAVQDTGAVRSGDGRGRHTTTVRSLHRLPCGACIIDTPGVRTLRPASDIVGAGFDDVVTLARTCRFRNCAHAAEPGCAVREGVQADRLANFKKLEREQRRDTMSALERREQLKLWKARGRASRLRERTA
ncbi:MAG: ribosome small subunit-dependent GTPase A [Burkholderiaceae bacterium]